MERVKGFFLTIDSMLALLIAITAIALLVFPQKTIDAESNVFETILQKMDANSTIGFYQRKTPSDYGLSDPSTFTSKNWKCAKQLLPIKNGTDLENIPLNSLPDYDKYSYCEES